MISYLKIQKFIILFQISGYSIPSSEEDDVPLFKNQKRITSKLKMLHPLLRRGGIVLAIKYLLRGWVKHAAKL
jgi:hypothetical protein